MKEFVFFDCMSKSIETDFLGYVDQLSSRKYLVGEE